MKTDIDSPTLQNTVIIADNSATLRLIIKRVLEKTHHVLEATSGTEVTSLVAMTLANQGLVETEDDDGDEHLAILIIGFELSGGHGLDIITKLRKVYDKQDLPIILNTSNNRRENIQQAIAAGINDYIVKPFAGELLETKVQFLLSQASHQSLDLSQKVSRIPFFKDVPEHVVARAITNCAVTSDLDTGSVICNQGESNFDLFILMEGKCDVLYNDRKVSEINPIGSIGEMGFLEHENRSATVVTSQPSILVTFNKDKLDNFLNEDRAISEIIYKNVIHTLSDRLKESNRLLERLKKDMSPE